MIVIQANLIGTMMVPDGWNELPLAWKRILRAAWVMLMTRAE